MLVQYFTDIMDVGFTANMEEQLDQIEEGGKGDTFRPWECPSS